MKKQTGTVSESLSERDMQIISYIKNDPVPTVPPEEIKAVCRAAASYYTENQSVWKLDFWKTALSCLTAWELYRCFPAGGKLWNRPPCACNCPCACPAAGVCNP